MIELNGRECAKYVWAAPEKLTSIGFVSDFKRLQMVLLDMGYGLASRTVSTSGTAADDNLLS